MQIDGKKITTIISDLDGTLLGQGTELDEEIFSIIRQLKKKGVAFVAASGRQYSNMRCLFEPIVEEIPFICENGSLIVRNDKTVYVQYIPRVLSFELIDDLLTIPGAETVVSSERKLYTLAGRKEFVAHVSGFLRSKIGMVETYHMVTGEINKVSIWWPGGIPDQEADWLHKKYDDRLQVVDSGNGWLDFTMKGVSKGVAIRELAALEGFPLQQTLCFGDSENDISMFHECAVSYAMETAKPYVLAEADHVCSDVKTTLLTFLEEA